MRFFSLGSSAQGGRLERATQLVLLLLLTASLGLNAVVAHRLRRLEARVGPARPPPLAVGAAVPPIVATGLDGRSDTIAYAGSPRLTVLYVFTPQCGWCAKNMDNFKTLLRAKAQDDRFIGLSLSEEGVADYVRTHELTLPIFTSLSSETISAYKLGGTPQTLVISPAGRVVKNWSGAWIDKQKADIEAFFQVQLPGLSPAPEQPARAKPL